MYAQDRRIPVDDVQKMIDAANKLPVNPNEVCVCLTVLSYPVRGALAMPCYFHHVQWQCLAIF